MSVCGYVFMMCLVKRADPEADAPEVVTIHHLLFLRHGRYGSYGSYYNIVCVINEIKSRFVR